MKDEKPKFDADFSPDAEVNQEAARARNLTFDERRQVYVDDDGCPIRDKFGQALG